MSARALILTYHAIEPGPSPLCIEPSLFAAQLDLIVEAGVRPVSLDRLVDELHAGEPREPSVAITFDDGYASVVERAAPILADRETPATVFCVAGHLGAYNDWSTAPGSAPRLRLASAKALAGLPGSGMEVGSHGMTHLPLALVEDSDLERELVDSRATLEDAASVAVRWFAYPYGSKPGLRGRELVERTYAGAVGVGNRSAGPGADRWRLPRIEMHYLRRPALLRRVLEGGELYLALRRTGARARRLVRADYHR
jgi:peptidoglycan/xylan/chitin deacetylase (PgdA/CDA1 family)